MTCPARLLRNELPKTLFRSAKQSKSGLEGKLEGFNAKIYMGDEADNPILVEEVDFPFAIVGHYNYVFAERPKFVVGEKVRESLGWVLKYIFSYDDFREGQLEAIERIMLEKDTIVLLPTGAGKSLIFQFLSMIMPGVMVVVEPLRALMEDQVANLKLRGVRTVINLSDEVGQKQRKHNFAMAERGVYSLVYITPERMQMREFRNLAEKMKENGVAVTVLVLDEAHCVSEWGHDFRVSYLNLTETARKLFAFRGVKPSILALTGTASDNVLRDMERDIGINEDDVVQPESFDRKEIHFRVVRVPSEEKYAQLLNVLDGLEKDFSGASAKDLSGIIFCVYKSETSEFGVETVQRRLKERYGEEMISKYYGGDEKALMRENMRRFLCGETKMMVATKAFGMGVDKADIRYTVHYGITNSIEAYYQEAGRAGRDGQKAMSYILLSNDMPERNEELLANVEIGEMRRALKVVGERGRDDVNRILFLHQKIYDKNIMMGALRRVVEAIGFIPHANEERRGVFERKIVARGRLEFEAWQRALFRLKLLDVLDDYVIYDYANNEFMLVVNYFNAARVVRAYGEYVARYQEGIKRHEMNKVKRQVYGGQKEFLMTMAELLIDFTEEIFEKSRRRAIRNMLELAEVGARIKDLDKQDDEIRRRVVNYLGTTHKELLKKILNDETFVKEALEAVKRVRKRDEQKLLAEAKRKMASFPEHLGLMIVVIGIGCIDERTEAEQVVTDILSADETSEKYGFTKGRMVEYLVEMLKWIYPRVRDEVKFEKVVMAIGKMGGVATKEQLMDILPERYTYGFQGEKLMLDLAETLSSIKYEERDLWTGKKLKS